MTYTGYWGVEKQYMGSLGNRLSRYLMDQSKDTIPKATNPLAFPRYDTLSPAFVTP